MSEEYKNELIKAYVSILNSKYIIEFDDMGDDHQNIDEEDMWIIERLLELDPSNYVARYWTYNSQTRVRERIIDFLETSRKEGKITIKEANGKLGLSQ